MARRSWTRTVRDTGAEPADVVRAFVVVDALTAAASSAARAAALGAEDESRVLAALLPSLERAVRWLLATYASLGAIGPSSRASGARRPRATRLPPAADERPARPRRGARRRRRAARSRRGLRRRRMAARGARGRRRRRRASVADARAGAAYWRVGDVVDFDWLRRALEKTR